jgi:hypothetical protein
MKVYNKILFFVFLGIAACHPSDKDGSITSSTDTNFHSSDNQPAFDLTGEWNWQDSITIFSVTLKQVHDSLYGDYCATAYAGSKVDCSTGDDGCSLQGKIYLNSASISFTSCYIEATGQASLTFNSSDGRLLWKLGHTSDIVYAPDSATLTRQQTSH